MKQLALEIQGYGRIEAPSGVPQLNTTTTLSTILGNVWIFMIVIAVLLALVYLVWGGLNWITSGGDKQKLADARKRVLYAIIGLIIALLSFFFINVIGRFFGIAFFK